MEILIVSHRGTAKGIKSTAEMVLGDVDQIKAIELTEEGVDKYAEELESYLLEWLTEGKKGIVFADIRGGTPFNQAELMLNKHHLKERAKLIAGVNLPMVVAAYFGDVDIQDPEALERLMQDGREGILCTDLQEATASCGDE